MLEFPEQINMPLGAWVDAAMDWVMQNFIGIFDALGFVILKFMIWVEDFFLWLPWPVLVVGVGLLAWRVMGRWWMGLLMSAMIFYHRHIRSMGFGHDDTVAGGGRSSNPQRAASSSRGRMSAN